MAHALKRDAEVSWPSLCAGSGRVMRECVTSGNTSLKDCIGWSVVSGSNLLPRHALLPAPPDF